MDRNEQAVSEMKEKDFKKRVEGFLADYKILTEKWDVDYVQYPMYVPVEVAEGEPNIFQTVLMNQPSDLRLKRLNDSFISK